MCGSTAAREAREQAAGHLNSLRTVEALRRSDWLSIADDLSGIDEEAFEKLISAFRLYRRSVQIEKGYPLPELPPRPTGRGSGR